MTRTGYSVRLGQHLNEPYISLHPDDARDHGIVEADLVKVRSTQGNLLVRALITDRQSPGQVFVPMHWSGQFASQAQVNALIAAVVDPYSQQPASKKQAVSIARHVTSSYAFGVFADKPDLSHSQAVEYWAVAPVDHGWQLEAASRLPAEALKDVLLQGALAKANPSTQADHEPLEHMESFDPAGEWVRAAVHEQNRLRALVYVSGTPVKVSRSWVRNQLSPSTKPASRRWHLLAGYASSGQPDKGPVICSCFSVGMLEIERALMGSECHDVDSVGRHLQAGSNCGSCKCEIQTIVDRIDQTLNRKWTTSPSRMM